MILSIPIATTSESCSERDLTRTLPDLIQIDGSSLPITQGMELKAVGGEDIYTYSLSKTINIPIYDKFNDYVLGDIVVHNRKHYEITGVVLGAKTPKEPDQYAHHETTISNFPTWQYRYWKHPVSHARHFKKDDREYWFQKASPCSRTCKGWEWKAWDRTSCGCHSVLYQCVQPNHSYRYTSAKDVKAVIKKWAGSCSPKEDTLIIKSVIERGGFFYFRTWNNAPIEYNIAPNKYTLTEISSPKEINGFRFNRKTPCASAFDNKNYTLGIFEPECGYVDFTFTISDFCDTVALGRVLGEKLSITARDKDNNSVIATLIDYPINNDIGVSSLGQEINAVLYSTQEMKPSTKIIVRIYGGQVRLGRILAGQKMRVGFTNTLFENGYKDFSPKEQDQWGNIVYKNGVRVFTHKGTVDMPTKEYDRINRAFMYVGGQEMIINSSDSINNTPPNSLTIFQSTMMIGRFKEFSQKTKNIGDIMDTTATYSFAIEESV